MRIRTLSRALALGFGLVTMVGSPALAGPPFNTDDPEPTPYKTYEIDIASDYARSPDGVSGTLPHLDLNYGLMPNVQFTITVPYADSQASRRPLHLGLGDAVIGTKIRVLRESRELPEISFAPAVDIPSGKAQSGLGAGYTRAFFPVWLQKSFGRYSIYGGGGLWRNPGAGNRNFTFNGVTLLREMRSGLTLGTEIFRQSADTVGGHASLGFSVGTIKQIDAHHGLLFSLGRSIHGGTSFSGYAGYQILLGPRARFEAPEDP